MKLYSDRASTMKIAADKVINCQRILVVYGNRDIDLVKHKIKRKNDKQRLLHKEM